MKETTRGQREGGFAKLPPEVRRARASKGGKAVHAQGKAHVFTSEEAKIAGRKGGEAIVERYGRGYFEELGRKGGQASQRNRRKERDTDPALPLEAEEG